MASTTAGLVHPAIAAIANAALEPLRPGSSSPEVDPVTLEVQRATLARILELGGPGDVLLAGRRFDRFPEYPLLLVLLNSDSVPLLIEKIARLNRYFHSHHRHQLLVENEESIELEHVSIRGQAPAPVDSLFAAGLYLAVLEGIGCRGLQCTFPQTGALTPVYADGQLVGDVPVSGTARWRFAWERFEPGRMLPGVDRLILNQPGLDLEDSSVAGRVSFLLERDLGRRWRVSDIAGELMMSPRTLQRRLGGEGTTLTALLAECRIANARRLLVETSTSITDIGYMLGYSDTPHFTRSFTAAVGRSPSQWRSQRRRSR